MIGRFILAFVLFFCITCTFRQEPSTEKADQNQTLFKKLDIQQSGINFENKVTETPEFNVITYRNFYNGGGVAIGDINNDGLSDIYFTANQSKNKLYLNKGNLQFEDITDKANVGGTKAWSTGVSMADVNGDGWLDIYVCNSGDITGGNRQNELFINNGDLSFTEKAKEYQLDNDGYSTHAAFFDYDRDGDLDCYLLNNSFKNPDRIEIHQSMRETPDPLAGDKLFRNDINTTKKSFTDVTTESHIYSSAIGFGLGVGISDLNNDGWADMYISNDFFEKDYMYINNGMKNGKVTFTESMNERLDYCSTSSMGSDIADINGDGFMDIFSTDMLPGDNDRIKRMVAFEPYHLEDYKYRNNYHYQFTQNCLHLNDGKANFQEIANLAGVAATDWSWGALLFDFQNDGTTDIFVSNGIYKDIMEGDFRDFVYDDATKNAGMGEKNISISNQLPSTPITNYAFVNESNLKFTNQANTLGLSDKTFSNGAAYGDLDNDGDLDLVINNVNQQALVYTNNANLYGNHFIKIKCNGDSMNRYGIGAKIIAQAGDRKWVKENFTNRGFQSSIEPLVTIGLGKIDQLNSLTIIWPNGKSETKSNISTNKVIEFNIADANNTYDFNVKPASPLFKELPATEYLPGATHTENQYNDFNQEPLLVAKLSTLGPKLLKADVNKDGLEDLLLLGAKGDADKLFIQNNNGTFSRSNTTIFDRDKNFESTCGAFFDFEDDGDMDILIGAGSNEVGIEQLEYIVRLYINDGRGNFKVDPANIPPVVGNFSTINVADIDKDGLEDVFFGARAVVGHYGLIPSSYLLKNTRGGWTDLSTPALSKIGMVTDAKWADVNNDTWPDLIITSEWKPIQLYINKNGTLNEPEKIPNTSGLWQRIQASDLDKDGDIDFVVGNWGLNSKLQASISRPLTMQVGDFDTNTKSEFIINWYAPDDTKPFPFCTKPELTAQIPSLRKSILKYKEFASMSFAQLFPSITQDKYNTDTVHTLATGILWNTNGSMEFQTLPIEAQFSPTYGILLFDHDLDNDPDILLGGNLFGTKPQMGRLSAGRGVLLQNDGNKKFTSLTTNTLFTNKEVRDLQIIGDKIIVAVNNGECIILKK